MSDLKLSWWDRFLIGVAPGWGLNRIRSRAAATLAVRHFEAAGTGRRTSGWYRSPSDANVANSSSIVAMRELSRDLRRNNGWARRGIQVLSTNTVGWGIEAKAMGASAAQSAEIIDLWHEWASTTDCDYDGRLPFAGLQRLVMDTVAESGEALVVRERANSGDGLPVPMRIRVLEPDYIDTSMDGKTRGGNPVVQGVELDGRGRRVAYWLYEEHPGSSGLPGFTSLGTPSKRVPAENVLHVYKVDRPGQLRGVPWLAAAVAKLNDLSDFDDARLMQQKIAACFGAFVTDLDGTSTAVGEQDPDDERLETLEPGHIEYLAPGKSISFPTPPSVADHGGYTETQLRQISANLGVTYEDMTTDYSKVNFSSARMARLAHQQVINEIRWNMLIPQFCDGVWGWVMEMAAEMNGWPEIPKAEWSAPPMPMLAPEKEGLAYSRLVRSGAMTLYQVIRERGEDPATHLAEIAESNAKLDELGIVLDSDARKTSGAGQEQPSTTAAGDE